MINCTHIYGSSLKCLLLALLFAISAKAYSFHQIQHNGVHIVQRQNSLIKGRVAEAVATATIVDVDLTPTDKVKTEEDESLTTKRLIATAAEVPVCSPKLREVSGVRQYARKQLRFIERWKQGFKTKALVEENVSTAEGSKGSKQFFKWSKAFSLKTILKKEEGLEQDALVEDVLEIKAPKLILRPTYVAPRTYASERQPIRNWKTSTPKPRDWFEVVIITLGFNKEMEYSTPVPCPLRAAYYDMSTIRRETAPPSFRRRILAKAKQGASSGKRKLAINFNKTRFVLGKRTQIAIQASKVTFEKIKIKVERAIVFCASLYEKESDFEKYVL